jgi:hypothetical protein
MPKEGSFVSSMVLIVFNKSIFVYMEEIPTLCNSVAIIIPQKYSREISFPQRSHRTFFILKSCSAIFLLFQRHHLKKKSRRGNSVHDAETSVTNFYCHGIGGCDMLCYFVI